MGDKSPEKRAPAANLKPKTLSAKNIFSDGPSLWIVFLIILTIAVIAYAGSLSNGFVWDDETFILNNPFVHDISLWKEYFTRAESVSNEPVLSRMYRPLQTISFGIDWAIWGNRPSGFHLTSLILHILSCLAIFFAFRAVTGIKPAVIASLVFAIHPALSEGVLSLASRGNQLYALFGLLSLGFFLRIARPFDLTHVFSILTLTLSLFSKEPAISIIALFPLIQAAFKKPYPLLSKKSVLLHAPFIASGVVFLAVRSNIVSTMSAVPYWGGSLLATIQMQAKVFVIYLGLVAWPYNLKGRYAVSFPAAFPDMLVIGAILINLAIILSAIILYRRGTRGRYISLAAIWFYISLAPVSNLIPVPGSMLGERFLYFTLAGVFPFLAGAMIDIEWKGLKVAISILCILVAVSWLITDIRRTAVWKNNYTFFSILSEQEPDNPVVQARMAQEELAYNNPAPAVKRLERVIRFEGTAPLPEDRAKLHYWFGRALLEANRPSDAFREFSAVAALESKPSKEIIMLLAQSAALSGDFKTALLILEDEAKTSPNDDGSWNGIGNVFIMMGDIKNAISSYKRALEINPKNAEAAANLQNAIRNFSMKPGSNR